MTAPGADERPPRVDERLAPPEVRIEYIGGVEYFAAPADEPHGTRHHTIDYVVGANVAPGYDVAVDMLTRTSETDDFAPDVSIFPAARNPQTGGRQLEELAFEIASEQSIGVPTKKARELARRGVRRIFCVLVKQGRVLEWSRATDGWQTLEIDGVIDDPVLVRPVSVSALLEAADADDEVARGLLAKGNRVFGEESERVRGEGKAEGELAGIARSVVGFLEARGLDATDEQRATILGCTDRDQLERWIRAAARVTSVSALFGSKGTE